MEEISSDILLDEIGRELHSAYHKSLRVCTLNLKCKNCPLNKEHMVQEHGTNCLAFLIGTCLGMLMQIANSLEEKG